MPPFCPLTHTNEGSEEGGEGGREGGNGDKFSTKAASIQLALLPLVHTHTHTCDHCGNGGGNFGPPLRLLQRGRQETIEEKKKKKERAIAMLLASPVTVSWSSGGSGGDHNPEGKRGKRKRPLLFL